MCWLMFGCCDTLRTIKAFDIGTFALDWSKLKTTTNATAVDWSVMLWNGDLLVYGSKVSGATAEGVLVTRDPDTGAPVVYSTSTPLTATEAGGNLGRFAEDANETDGAWLYAENVGMYWGPAGLDDPIVQGASVTLNVSASNRQKLFFQDGASLISGKDSTTIAKWDSSGSETTSLATSALSLTATKTLSGSAFAIENRNASPVLFYGRETGGGTTLRRVWQVDSSLTEVAAVTGGTNNDFTYTNTDSIHRRPWTPDGNYAFIRTSLGVQRIDLSTLAFGWHDTTNTVEHVLCADDTQVYVIVAVTGFSRRLRAINVASGATVWTTGTINVTAAEFLGRVTSVGIAVWWSTNLEVYNTTTGALVDDTIDDQGATTGAIKDVVEYDGRLYVVGVQRD